MEKISLQDYNIYISENFSDQLSFPEFIYSQNYSSIVILADKNTEQHCLSIILPYLSKYSIIIIEPGEQHKHIDTSSIIWEELMTLGVTRKSLLINLGGGVIGDMGGFAAGTFKRGFDFINIPTTLLAQVDASVGGKTGIDFKGIKNLIGLFNDPKNIFISSEFLKTLPSHQLRSGFAEVLKHGLIADKNYWHKVKLIDLSSFNAWLPIIKRSVEIKKHVVESDPHESGKRKVLNFGHTIGHAVETISLKTENSFMHGEAVAIGMICEAWLSNQVSGLSNDDFADIVHHIQFQFPKQDIAYFDFSELMQLMKMDKKNNGDEIQFSLLTSIGECNYDMQVSDALIQKAIKFYINL